MRSTTLDNESDGQLIRRFAQGRDERAFAKLVERHGALVAGVCARLLHNRADAEDAFQAVFLVLSRRAGALRRQASLAAWLHNVAVRVCLNERKIERRRKQRVQEAAEVAREPRSPERLEELKRVIDEELAALPRRLSEVLVLCDLEGRTREEVARTLSLPTSTVSSRLTRGREEMRKRLIRHGLQIAVGGVSFALTKCSQAAPAVSAELVHTTVRSANIFLSGTAASKTTLGIKISTLAEGVLHAMILSQWKTAACLVALIATSLFGGAVAPQSVPMLTATATAKTILIDDFSDGDDNGWAYADGTIGLPFGPGVFDATSGDYRLSTTGPVPSVELGNVASLWSASAAAQYQDGFVRSKLSAQLNTVAYVILRGNATLGEFYLFGIDPSNDPPAFFFNRVANYRVMRTEGFDLPGEQIEVGEEWIVEAGAVGSSLSMKAWKAADPEPTSPQLTLVDSTIQNGLFGVGANEFAPLPHAPTVVSATFDDIYFTPVPEPATNSLAAVSGALLIGGMSLGRLRILRRWSGKIHVARPSKT